MKKLNNKQGYSTTEVFCITFITCFAIFFLIMGVLWYRKQQYMGEDKILLNTAESVATIHSAGDGCVVRGCGGGDCKHHTSEGYVGYFDHPSNTIYGEKREGYNNYKVMEIDGKKYYGAKGTMVIRVVKKADDTFIFSWVKGKS